MEAGNPMRISAIRQRRGSPSRVEIHLGGARIAMAAEVAMRAGLHVGQELDAVEIQSLEAADLAWRCKEMALSLLSYRPRSERELKQRLLSRKMPPPVVDACLAELRRAGLLDDDAFAGALARERLRTRPVGRARLSAELRAKGVDPDVSEAAVEQAFGEGDGSQSDAARRAAARFRRRAGEDDIRARRRLYGFLARRGFPSETILEVIDQILRVE